MNKVDMGSRKNHRLQLIVPFSWVLAGMKGFKQIKNVKEFIPTTIFFFFFFFDGSGHPRSMYIMSVFQRIRHSFFNDQMI